MVTNVFPPHVKSGYINMTSSVLQKGNDKSMLALEPVLVF